MTTKRLGIIALTIAVAVAIGSLAGLYVVSIGGKSDIATKTTTAPEPIVQTIAFSVHESGKPWAFVKDGISNPTIRVKLGSTVRVVLDNTGVAPHDWALDTTSPSPYNISTEEIKPGESGAVEFIADKLGVFRYHCATKDHREYGMQGEIIIES